jgi:hypothetical protein
MMQGYSVLVRDQLQSISFCGENDKNSSQKSVAKMLMTPLSLSKTYFHGL